MLSDNPLSKTYVFQSPAILIFPKKLFIPEKYIPKGETDPEKIAKIEPKYQADFMVPFASPDFEAIRAFVGGLALEKWPGANLGALDAFGKPAFLWPWKNGDEQADDAKAKKASGQKKYDLEFQRGHLVLHTSAVTQPDLGGFENGAPVQFGGDKLKLVKDKFFFFGSEVFPSVTFVARDGTNATKPAVNAYVNGVVSTGRGKKIGGGRPDFNETLAMYAGRVETTPTTRDSDIPF